MPADPRRATRKLSSEEEIELKRARGEISCAECRRLKLKCDKKLPCGSCSRRGCATICPNGSLCSGQGTRFILADTDQLHRKITEMSERIRQLEDALAILQLGLTSDPHPLLRDELLSIKFGFEAHRTTEEESTKAKLAASIDALGTLTIGEHGETNFIGRSGASETLFMEARQEMSETAEGADDLDGSGLDVPLLEDDLENISIAFPLTIVEDGTESILHRLELELPPQPRAWALCEAYLAHFTWWFRPIKRDELINEILSPIYKTVSDPTKRDGYHPNSGCGASPEAERYYRLGRAALSLRSIFDSPEFETIQAITLMGAYHSMCNVRYSTESAWAIISYASKLSHSLGLHRDPARWQLEPKIIDRRRNLFWELFLFEGVHSITLGRPPSLSFMHIDCELPRDEEGGLDEDGQPTEGYWHFKMSFQRSMLAHAHDTLLVTEAPNYEVILDADKKIRQLWKTNSKPFPKPEDEEYSDSSLCMQSCLASQLCYIPVMSIHRTHFTQSLLDHPSNPLKSPYAPSFLAANQCASVIIKSFLHHCERSPSLYGRFWSIWTHAFAACMILGSTVARCPSVTMAPSALVEFDSAVELFKRCSKLSRRAREALPMLMNLRTKASHSYQQYNSRHVLPVSRTFFNPGDQEEEAKLAMFGGKTRVLQNKLLSRRSVSSKKSSTSSPHSGSEGSFGDKRELSTSPVPPPRPAEIAREARGSFDDIYGSVADYVFPPGGGAPQPAGSPRTNPLVPPSTSTNTPSPAPDSPSTAALQYARHSHSSYDSSVGGFTQYPNYSYPSIQTTQAAAVAAPVVMGNPGSLSEDGVWYTTDETYVGSYPGHSGGDNHASLSEQWLSLMRNSGIFEQPPAIGGATEHAMMENQVPGVPDGALPPY